MEWRVRKLYDDEDSHEPVEASFFTALDSPIDALVRESIQNSLDAARRGPDGKALLVAVRIATGTATGKALGNLQQLAPHLKAADHLEGADRAIAERVPFLVVEDFGTTGLRGPPEVNRPHQVKVADADAGFLYFWRLMGMTGKQGNTRGSWGLGKAVYPASSLVKACIGWTVRQEDGRSLLMGKATIGDHQIDGVAHSPYAYLGQYPTSGPALAQPVESSERIKDFKNSFSLKRETEPGFSVVVPHPQDVLVQDQAHDALLASIIQQYAYPLLAGQLAVDVETPSGGKERLTAGSLTTVLARIDLPPEQRERLGRLIELARSAIVSRDPVRLQRSGVGKAVDWEKIEFDPADVDRARDAFDGGAPLHVRVPLTVKPRRGIEQESFFDLFLKRDDDIKATAVSFIRQGLTISNVKSSITGGLAALVVVEDRALAEMLRAAEGPAHTDWHGTEEKLTKGFIGGDVRIKFVTSAPARLVRLLTDADDDLDREFLSDMFPDLTEPTPRSKKGRKKKGRQTPPMPPPPPPKPKSIVIVQSPGGFSVRREPGVPLPGDELELQMGFDCAVGDPLKQWEAFDFDVTEMSVEVAGARIAQRSGNVIRLADLGDDFRLAVSGFDEHRDLAVDHSWKKLRADDRSTTAEGE